MKIILVPALLAAFICAGSTTEAQSNSGAAWHENPLKFPIIPPIPDADPSVRRQVVVEVPRKLTIARTTNTLSIAVDRGSLETTNITVGAKMVTGVRDDWFVYPEGDARPSRGRSGLTSGLDLNLGTAIWNVKQGGIPVPGQKYVVEMDLAIFETDIPPQHEWSPNSKNYRILWKRTLRQVVE